MKVLALVLFAAVAANAFQAEREFGLFKLRHAKTYQNAFEHEKRKSIFSENLRYIMKHNAEAALGKHTYTLAINQFADLTHGEFQQKHLAQPKSTFRQTVGKTNIDVSSLPAEVDWRNEGYVTPIKDQGQCGSCWTFSAVVSMEGQHFKSSGTLESLSEQQLLDCVHPYEDGCNGGFMDDAFEYATKSGMNAEGAYPYEAVDQSCAYDSNGIVATITGYTDVTAYSEDALQEAVANVGPISIGIDASHLSFQFYSDGVYTPSTCSSYSLDHGVAAVGYGTYQGNDYWMVKNSWGTGWGMSGYIMMARNHDNLCGVASMASYPTV